MPRRRRPLSELLDVSVFSTAEALAAGVARRRLSGTETVRLSYGVHASREVAVTELDVVRAYQRTSSEAVACGNTAARLLGLPLPAGSPPWSLTDPRFRIHLSSPDSHRHSSGRLHWSRFSLSPEDVIVVDGVRITSRPRTLLDLAGNVHSFGVDDLVAIGDHLVRIPRPRYENRAKPHSTIQTLRELAAAHRGRGARRLRTALELVVVGSDSPAETALRLAMIRAGLPMPQANAQVFDGAVDLGRPDLSWPEWRVCLEHEGPHHRSPDQQEKDIARGELRRDHGWIELQTTARDLHRGAARAVRRAEERLRQNGWPGSTTAPR